MILKIWKSAINKDILLDDSTFHVKQVICTFALFYQFQSIMEVGVPMEMSFLTYNNMHDEFSVETHHKGSRLLSCHTV